MMSRLAPYRRIVVKVGSSLIMADGQINTQWLDSLGADLAELLQEGKQVIVVSSGSVAVGRRILGLAPQELALSARQAAAAAGQMTLAHAWCSLLAAHGLHSSQFLLSLGDTEHRQRHLNARAAILRLIEARPALFVPVINENDTTAVETLAYGDNDRLAARVGTMVSADMLVMLTDQNGLFTCNPRTHADARHIPEVKAITPEIEAMAASDGGVDGRGGMRTKIEAARIAVDGGCHVLIGQGHGAHPLRQLDQPGRATFFVSERQPLQARKRWILGSLAPRGRVVVDSGAALALRQGKSLLPAGVTAVEGRFAQGDALEIHDPGGRRIGVGLSGYGAAEAQRIRGKRSGEIRAMLGAGAGEELIHRDNMALVE